MKNIKTTLKYIFYSLCIVLFFNQCTKDTAPEEDDLDVFTSDTGYLSISPSIDVNFLKSAQVVETDSFKVEIFNLADVLVQEIENFIDISSPIELPVGDYYVIIHSNNLVSAAFENPFYEGRSVNFQISKSATTNVDVTAELANVKVTVEYGAQAQSDFIDFRTVVSTGTDSLTYLDQETTAGYFIVTPLSVRVYLTFLTAGGSTDSLVITGEIPNPQAKDHIVLTIQASLVAGGTSNITLTVDESTNPVNITIEDTTSSETVAEVLIDARDAQEYATVQIGDQVWMAENLNFLPATASLSSMGLGSENTPFYYQVDPAKGVLYNWPAAMDNTTTVSSQGVCPSGWHIPSSAEWDELENFIQLDNSTPVAGIALKTTNGWSGTDDYGFAALPGGRRFSSGGFGEGSSNGYWWTSNENGSSANFRGLDFSVTLISNTVNKSSGMSIRCIQD
jgi:uncharacterized protein (TIGR02145 family)